ncbi:hypothetical protein R1flu_018134 [Riccia fluitans]|uniref:Uncharacterized protein n=1 Tax=Riccia fluitans TaxID=41844 RepID=A0ABD1ZGC5_9MARC
MPEDVERSWGVKKRSVMSLRALTKCETCVCCPVVNSSCTFTTDLERRILKRWASESASGTWGSGHTSYEQCEDSIQEQPELKIRGDVRQWVHRRLQLLLGKPCFLNPSPCNTGFSTHKIPVNRDSALRCDDLTEGYGSLFRDTLNNSSVVADELILWQWASYPESRVNLRRSGALTPQ